VEVNGMNSAVSRTAILASVAGGVAVRRILSLREPADHAWE